jgi:hypothetical protein
VDPIAAEYPELTAYQFASNTPIWAIDLDGLEARVMQSFDKSNRPVFTIILDVDIIDMTDECELGYGKACMNIMFRKEVLKRIEFRLSSNTLTNPELTDEQYIFEFGDVDIFAKDEEDKATKPFKIVLTNLNTNALERKLDGDTYGQVTIGETQSNTINIDMPAILSKDEDPSQQLSLLSTTLAHEIGHALGLRHAKNEKGKSADPESNWEIDPNNKETTENLMRSEGAAESRLLKLQFKELIKTIQNQAKTRQNNGGN